MGVYDTTLTDTLGFCDGVGTYEQKLCHVFNSQEGLGTKMISNVFKCLFEPRIDGCELDKSHQEYFVNDDDIHCLKTLEGQVGLLKGVKRVLNGKSQLPIHGCN